MKNLIFLITGLVFLASCNNNGQSTAGNGSQTDTVVVHDTVRVKPYHKRYCMALDLKDDSALIKKYEKIT